MKAYVEYIHYVEGLYDAAKRPAGGHAHEAECIEDEISWQSEPFDGQHQSLIEKLQSSRVPISVIQDIDRLKYTSKFRFVSRISEYIPAPVSCQAYDKVQLQQL